MVEPKYELIPWDLLTWIKKTVSALTFFVHKPLLETQILHFLNLCIIERFKSDANFIV